MANRNSGYGPTYAGPYQGAPGAYGPQQAPQRRIDLLDVVEGVLTDGLSISNFSRIARASGSKFWLGAAIGAGLVALAHRPDVRAAVGGAVEKVKARSRPDDAQARAREPAED